MSVKEIFSEILEDAQSVIRSPEETYRKILSSRKTYYSKAFIVFFVFMNSYFLFLPSNLVIMNILTILIFVLVIGFTYYFMQELAFTYRDLSKPEIEDDKTFYKVAYCFSIANSPALFLNLLNNILCLLLTKNLIAGVFFGALFSIVIAIIGLVYVLKALKVYSNGEAGLQEMIEISTRSLVTTVQETFGLRAMQDLLEDFKAAP